ncbi:MAG: site-specific integrase [Clostridiaceae bacterium]|nr:site-specific integrase [Clostridiaceae bacterium]
MKSIQIKIEEFMIYSQSKNLSRKTMMSYEQTLKLFCKYLLEEKSLEDVAKVTEKDIREYIIYTRDSGKYTIVTKKETLKNNTPEARDDYGTKVSLIPVNNYTRNINQIKTERKPKKFITDEQFSELLRHIDTTKFHEVRDFVCVQLLLDSGMSISECLEIKVQNIDINSGIIMVCGK